MTIRRHHLIGLSAVLLMLGLGLLLPDAQPLPAQQPPCMSQPDPNSGPADQTTTPINDDNPARPEVQQAGMGGLNDSPLDILPVMLLAGVFMWNLGEVLSHAIEWLKSKRGLPLCRDCGLRPTSAHGKLTCDHCWARTLGILLDEPKQVQSANAAAGGMTPATARALSTH